MPHGQKAYAPVNSGGYSKEDWTHGLVAEGVSALMHDAREGSAYLSEVWGEYLGLYDWHHYVTLTTGFQSISKKAMGDCFRKKFIRRLTHIAQNTISFFCVVELTTKQVPHIHALISGTRGLSVDVIKQKWDAICSVSRYQSFRGADHYVVKTLGTGNDDYDVSRSWPPLLQPGSGTRSYLDRLAMELR